MTLALVLGTRSHQQRNKIMKEIDPNILENYKILPSEESRKVSFAFAKRKKTIDEVLTLKREGCGANKRGGGGFVSGNDCASGGGVGEGGEGGEGGSGSERNDTKPEQGAVNDESAENKSEGDSDQIDMDANQLENLFAAQDNESIAPVENPHVIDPHGDQNGDGITDNSRVGVPAMVVPPPPDRIPRMPNLTADERAVENTFATAFEQDAEGMADDYYEAVTTREVNPKKPLDHKTFNTDDAKELSGDYAASLDNKARYNLAVHQTANAVAKKAFVKRLDEMAEAGGGEVLITMGGVAAGKGFATGQEFNDIADRFGAVWDSAGEQNGTEMPWLQSEFDKRGIKGTYVFVHTDPLNAKFSGWNAALKRAKEKGRTVDARLFAESYAIGSGNFERFAASNSGKADFMILDNRGAKTKLLPSIPKEDIPDVDELHMRALQIANQSAPTPAIKRGATIGTRVFKKGDSE